MTRAWLLLLIVLLSANCGGLAPVVLTAQSLPVTKTLIWDANPAADAVTSYTVRLDGAIIGSPTTPSQAITFATAGPHTITVTATNVWATSTPATLAVDVRVPGSPGNVRFGP